MLADGLVDELRLMVFPIVLGTGNRLFSDGTPRTSLRLVEARPVGPAGVVVLTYAAPTSPRPTGPSTS
jgi:dihydrofolate reductase